jgi:hypothetical protein
MRLNQVEGIIDRILEIKSRLVEMERELTPSASVSEENEANKSKDLNAELEKANRDLDVLGATLGFRAR